MCSGRKVRSKSHSKRPNHGAVADRDRLRTQPPFLIGAKVIASSIATADIRVPDLLSPCLTWIVLPHSSGC
jgi:hypothetical protein